MSQMFFTILATLNSLLFTKMNHPMNMGIILLIQTLLMCLMTGCMSQTTWFAYILFLVFLGGMLVLFIYMTSIASNEIFQKSNYMISIITFSIIFIMSFFVMLFMDPVMTSFNSTGETLPLMELFNNYEKHILMNLYNMPSATITVFMVLYLFLTLIIIVLITKSSQGPLRPSN